MNYRKLSILAAAVSLAMGTHAFAEDTTSQTTTASSEAAKQGAAQHSQNTMATEAAVNREGKAAVATGNDRDTHGALLSSTAQQNRDRMQADVDVETQPEFTEIDTDGDGYIASLDLDADSELRTSFADYDTDSDNRLSSTEYSAWLAATATTVTSDTSQQFVVIDTDNDGFISSTDLPTDSTLVVQFDTYDLDSDNRLSRTEYESWLSAQADASVASTTAPGRIVSDVAHTKRDFKQLDVDKDGSLSEAELALADASVVEQMDALDTDNDGMLSESEYRASAVAGTGFDEDFNDDTSVDSDLDVDVDAEADLEGDLGEDQ